MLEEFKPFSIEYPPAIGSIVDWNEGCAMITGWEFDQEGKLFICINNKLIDAETLFSNYTIEGHKAGYLNGEEDDRF